MGADSADVLDGRGMNQPFHIEGYAIVSANDMIADATGHMPADLRIEADQLFYQDSLDHVDLVVHGRRSHEGGANAARRRRIVVTREVAAIARDPDNARAFFWNPAGAPFEEACFIHGVRNGLVAVVGATGVFGLFLSRFDVFHLTRAAQARLAGGRPVFPGVPPRTAEEVLLAHGLRPGSSRVFDAPREVTLVSWFR